MHHEGIGLHIKVKIDLHSSVMGVAGHRIPYRPGFKMSQSHLELAGLHLSRKDIFVYGTVVGILKSTKLLFVLGLYHDFALSRCAFALYQHCGICHMGGSRVQIKLCGVLRIL